jgi:phosphatidylinositol-3,4,5-trisphosphate 3-phosphatase/dual-specificity protein phosphatase PTEN
LCSYLLSLSELPPPPQLDSSYGSAELAQRKQAQQVTATPKEEDREGFVYVGQGKEISKVPVHSTPLEDLAAGPESHLQVPYPRSTNSSTTTLSQPSPAPSIDIRTHTAPYDPIDIGDEQDVDAAGQQDRKDGRVDEVFKLHSSRRMKPTSTGRGVSIPSRKF